MNTASDIRNRLKYATTQIVVLVLTQSLVLKSGLVLGRGFSCTVFRPLQGKTGLKVRAVTLEGTTSHTTTYLMQSP